MTQKEMILNYLLNHSHASIRDLMSKCEEWINSPAEYISQLRREGYNIETTQLDGEKYKVYKLITKQQMEIF